jgi:DNA-binding winged helix-turn-helix (wHTH) protein
MRASSPETGKNRRLVFADFELRLDSGELRQGDTVARLQPQPARLLELLARRSGEVVSREELRREMWDDTTYVDRDQGINSCVRQLRRVLGERAEAPHFIETIPRRGYRFLLSVQFDGSIRKSPTEKESSPVGLAVRRRAWLLVPTSLALLWLIWRRPAERSVASERSTRRPTGAAPCRGSPA